MVFITVNYLLIKLQENNGVQVGRAINAVWAGNYMKDYRRLFAGFFIALFLLGTTGYVQSNNNEKAAGAMEVSHEKNANVISIGTVGNDAVKYIKRFQPTADYIAKKLSDEDTKYVGRVIVTETTEQMTELLLDQTIDFYVESPLTTAAVARDSGAVPYIRRWKEEVAEYHTVFVVKKDSDINTLEDFIGKTIAFQDPESTSGHLLPKSYLIKKGYELVEEEGAPAPKDKIGFVFTGDDENTVYWVAEGRVEIGAVSNIDLEVDAPVAIQEKIRIVDRTIDVPRHLISHRSGLDPVIALKVKEILFEMDKDPEGAVIMGEFKNTKKYDEIPDKEELFSELNELLTILGY